MIDYNNLKKANIYLRDNLVGELEKTPQNQFVFTYNDQWIESNKGPIGLSLPLNQKKYESPELFPFFDNLISEGWLLSHAEKLYCIDRENKFALLLATAQETIGAVTVLPLDKNDEEIKDLNQKKNMNEPQDLFKIEFSSPQKRCSYCLRGLNQEQLKTSSFHKQCSKKMWNTGREIKIYLSSRDPLSSFRNTIHGGSISGAQRKGLFHLKNGVLYPKSKSSQYIIKPQGDYPYLPQNEHLTMAIAKSIGFSTPPFGIFNIKKIGMVFIIKRFDITEEGKHLRLEDFAQVLNQLRAKKYLSSYEKLAKGIRLHSFAPTIDLFEMWKRLLFSFFIGNGDMHLKNWSLIELTSMKGIFRLSPCYDFLNTRLPLHDEDIDLALSLNGKKHKITKDLFVEFATQNNIQHLIDDVFSDLKNWMNKTEDLVQHSYLSEELKEKYLDIVKSRLKVLAGKGTAYL